MKKPNITPLRNRFMMYIGFTTILLVVIAVSVLVNLLDKHIDTLLEKEHKELHHAIENLQYRTISRYDNVSRRMIETTPMRTYMKNGEREKLYKLFKRKWQLFKEENPYLTILSFHNPNGTMFLRMHKPDTYGDQLNNIRPMIKEIHTNHKKLVGYETGKYSTSQRIITPLFDEKQQYIGALDIGINPNYLVKELKKLFGHKAVLFIKNKSLSIYEKPQKEFQFGDYVLASEIDAEIEDNLRLMLSYGTDLSNCQYLQTDGTALYSHLFSIMDYNGNEAVKMIFFHDVAIWYELRHFLMVLVIAIISAFSLILVLFIFFGARKAQEKIEKMYHGYVEVIENSAEYFKRFFHSAPLSYQSLDDEGNILMVNSQWLKELGYLESEVIGKKFTYFLTPEFKKIYDESFAKMKSAGGAYNIELDMIKKSGELVTVNYSNKTIYGDDNRVLRTHCIFTNVTKKKQELKEIAFNESYLNLSFETIPNIMFTTNGRFIDRANRLLLDKTGYDSIELFKEDHDCFCDYFEVEDGYIHSDMDGQNWLDYIYANPEQIHRVKINFESTYIYTVWAERLEFDDKERSIIILNDITELERSKKIYLEIFENTKVANIIYKSNDDGKTFVIERLNEKVEILEGVDRNEIIGKDITEVFPGIEEFGLLDVLRSVYSSGESKMTDLVFYKDALRSGWRENYVFKLSSGEIVASYEDKSSEVELQEELKVKDELMLAQSRHAAMGEMIGMIAHQWRQPITSIAMGANNIIVDAALGEIDKDSLNELASDIIDQTQYLSKTIDDFRNFFKPNKEREDINVCSVLDETLSIIGTSLANNNIEVEKELNCQSTISTYSRELLQVYINILKNAKEALLDKKIQDAKIIIRVSEDEKSVVTTICDNAGGIKPELLTKIFEPYFTTKDEKTGTGLGLYMSEIIVNKHLGGSLSVENGSDGACFSILLPKLIGNGLGDDRC